jgi:hypothetical protein
MNKNFKFLMKKTVRTLLLIFSIIPILFACCNEDTYEVTITGMESRALVLDGNNYKEFDVESPINKEDLLIEVLIIETERITSIEQSGESPKERKVVRAAVVPCGDQIVLFKNRIESFKVEITDPDNNSTSLDITEQLQVEGTDQSISEYIAENSPGIRGFLLEFSDISNIPDRIQYYLEATLDDGTKVSSEGRVVNFN